jgi:ABC-2 type transport system permease protein
VYALGNPPGNIDSAGVMGSYIGLILLGGVFCSVGILASSVTTNQIVAFISAAFLCYILFSGFDSIASINLWASNALFIKQLGIFSHYESLSKGLIDTRDVVYFFCVTFLMLLITKIVLGSRSW